MTCNILHMGGALSRSWWECKGYYEELLAFIYMLPEIMRGRLLIYIWKPLQ